jgi:biotin carboxyl carrier protein
MYEIKANGVWVSGVEKKQEQLLLNGKPVQWSCELLPDGSFSVLYHHRSYRAEVMSVNKDNKTVTLSINGMEYELQISEPVDKMLQAMGLEGRKAGKVNLIKAPMPGMVLNVLVTAGQQLFKGDPVIVLEAMKMENIFKAPEESRVKEVLVKEKTAVEKGQVLVVLE